AFVSGPSSTESSVASAPFKRRGADMRLVLISSIAWLGALQSLGAPIWTVDSAARWLGLASVLGTLTVLIYRLGVWRQQLEQTRDEVSAQVRAHREESGGCFHRIERRLEAMDHMLSLAADRQSSALRRQLRIERRLDRFEQSDTRDKPAASRGRLETEPSKFDDNREDEERLLAQDGGQEE